MFRALGFLDGFRVFGCWSVGSVDGRGLGLAFMCFRLGFGFMAGFRVSGSLFN